MSSIHRIPSPGIGVVGRVVDGEAVLVLPTQGKVKVLNEVGARIWSLVDGNRSVQEIASEVCKEYQVAPSQAEADCLSFLDELAARGVVTWK